MDVEEGRVVAVRGDASDPMSGGYTCMKGRQMAEQLHGSERLWRPLRSRPSGAFEPITAEAALDEIAERLKAIVQEHGPRAVAVYCGTCAYFNSATVPVVRAYLDAVGSPSIYSSLTIDQSAKGVAVGRIGMWGAGTHSFQSSNVALIVGNNPPVSHLAPPSGLPGFNPSKRLADALERGMKIVCVDPRRSELARRAHIHLQIRPGEDPTLLAGILRVILDEGLHDREFCDRHVSGLGDLRASIAEFTPEYVAARCEVDEALIVEAARLFARGPRGCATSGTGPDMGPHPALSEHLISALNIVCARVNRAGERIDNPGVLGPAVPRPAQAIPPAMLPPMFHLGTGVRARMRDLERVCDEMPTSTLADEILMPGQGQIRALVCLGGNPAVSVPNEAKIRRALESLDLLVCADLRMTETARLADFVLPARHPLERADATVFSDMFFEAPYAYYTEAVVAADDEVRDDWQWIAGIACRQGLSLDLPGGRLAGDGEDKFSVLEKILPGSRVPLAEVRAASCGRVFENVEVLADPPVEGLDFRLELAPPGICEELQELRSEWAPGDSRPGSREGFDHLLICRRMNEVLNSVGRNFPLSHKKAPTNPAYMHPDDLAAVGAAAGDLVEIQSEVGSIVALAAASDEVQPGVVSMAHGWGGLPGEDCDPRNGGANTNRLTADDRDVDPATGMVRQTAIPVRVRRAPRVA